jgi:spore coat protein A
MMTPMATPLSPHWATAVEVWEMINLTPDAHPIHVHLIQFQVLNQQPLNTSLYVNIAAS